MSERRPDTVEISDQLAQLLLNHLGAPTKDQLLLELRTAVSMELERRKGLGNGAADAEPEAVTDGPV